VELQARKGTDALEMEAKVYWRLKTVNIAGIQWWNRNERPLNIPLI